MTVEDRREDMQSVTPAPAIATKCKSDSLPSSWRWRSFSLRRVWAVFASALSLGLLAAFSAPAQAAPVTYWSAGTTCGNAAPSDFTPGGSITASLCAKNFAASEYICDFGGKLQVSDAAHNGLFAVTSRTTPTPGLDSVWTTNPAYPVAIANPADLPDWGAGATDIHKPVDPAGADVLLMTVTIKSDATATGGPYTIELGGTGYPYLDTSSSSTDCLTPDTTAITAAMTLTPTPASAPVMAPLSCGAALTNATTKTISFSASGGSGAPYTYQCKVDAGAFAACTSAYNTAVLADGAHTFSVHASDSASVQSADVSCSWTVDTTAPDVSLTATPPNPDTAASATFSFTSTDATATFECSLNNAAFAACTSGQAWTLATSGNQNFRVRAKDPAGNVTATPASYTWVSNFTASAPVINTVPTLSEWGLIVLAMLMAGFGMTASRSAFRRRGH